jgi:hypothetical protein
MRDSFDFGGLVLAYFFVPPLLLLAITISVTLFDALLMAVIRSTRRITGQSVRRYWQLDLAGKSRVRAGAGAASIVLAITLWAHGYAPMIGGYALAGLAGVGLLYMVGGLMVARNAVTLTYDPFSLMWWGLAALGCIALLVVMGIA